jgi:DNA-binding MarR family transcriptional regulator
MKMWHPSSPARYRTLLQLLRTADALWNTSRLFFRRWDLSPSQFNVLNLLSDQPRGLSQVELGRQLITHRSNVTGLVDRLEKRGLVARHDAAADRRAYRVVLTHGGSRVLEQVLPEYYALSEQLWDGMSTARARGLSRDLARLGAQAERIVPGERRGDE